MLQQLFGAVLVAGIVAYCISPPGRLHLTRHLPHGAWIRHLAIGVGTPLAALNVLTAFVDASEVMRDLVSSVTLLALAAWAMVILQVLPSARRARPSGARILAIGAHPDDLELACGASLAKLADAGYEIHGLVMSAGQVGGDSSLRPDEARAGGALMGLAQIEVLDFPDTALSSRGQDMVGAIEERMKALEPVLVLTHSEHDLHQDHHAVHLATLRAGRRHPSILAFESPSVTRSFNPSVFVDVRDYLDIKIEAIKSHRDQRGKAYMGADTVRGMAAFRGGQARIDYAEAFEPVRLLTGSPGMADLLAGSPLPMLAAAAPSSPALASRAETAVPAASATSTWSDDPAPSAAPGEPHRPAPQPAEERPLVGAASGAALEDSPTHRFDGAPV